jgi:hypothetical protein
LLEAKNQKECDPPSLRLHRNAVHLVLRRKELMSRLLATVPLAAILAIATPTAAESPVQAGWPDIIEAKDFDELSQKWCAASRDLDHIFILPASLFVNSRELVCDTGTYKLYRVVSAGDPEDFEYYIDPPFGNENRLGCDGKAGRKMEVVAVSCRPELASNSPSGAAD